VLSRRSRVCTLCRCPPHFDRLAAPWRVARLEDDWLSRIKGRARDVCEVDDIAESIRAADEAIAAGAVIGLDGALHLIV
jgi:hypothetical protein